MKEQRKLAAVMFTDIVGYTTLMSKDEQKALALLQKNRELQQSLAAKHNGEFLKEMGDGILLCFQSALDAVHCALEIQRTVQDDPDLNLRIGIHLGDIVFKDGDVFGDGVNVASRIEKLAETGGIYFSSQVHKTIRNKQGIEAVFLGEKRLKNVTDPVKIYALTGEGLSAPSVKDFQTEHKETVRKRLLKILLPVGIVLFVFVLGYVMQKIINKSSPPNAPGSNSIAVMYFENYSGEEDLERILTEMLTSNLSRCKEITVVSTQHLFDILKKMDKQDSEKINRNTARKVAINAKVKTMLLGSINRIGTRFEINAQLCNVKTGNIIGPSQVKGTRVEDIYQIVDQLTQDVIQLMGVALIDNSQSYKINDVTTHSFEAYKHYQKGSEHIRHFQWRNAVTELLEAVRVDTTFALAHALLAISSGIQKVVNPLSDLSREREFMLVANKYSAKATEKEHSFILVADALINRKYDLFLARAKRMAENYPDDKRTHYYLGFAHRFSENHEQAVQSFNRALEIDPKYANAYNMLGYSYSAINKHEKAISAVKKYIALQPDVINTYDSAFEIYLMAGRYEEANKVCEDALRINRERTRFTQYKSYIDLFSYQGDKAREKNRKVFDQTPSRELVLVDELGCFDMYEGRYGDAEAKFKKVISLARGEKNTEEEIQAHLVLGKFYIIQKRFSKAYQELSTVKNLSGEVYSRSYNTWPVRADYYYGVTAIHQGDFKKALAMAERIRIFIKEKQYDDILMDYYYLLLAEIHITKEQPSLASNMIANISQITRSEFPRCRRLMAELLVLQDKFENAFHAYQTFYDAWITSRNDNFFDYFLERSLLKYQIAKLYEKKGDPCQAIKYYEKALKQWENADEDMTEFIDASERLAALKGDR